MPLPKISPANLPKDFIHLTAVTNAYNVSRPTILKHIDAGVLPKRIKYGASHLGWSLSDIEQILLDVYGLRDIK